ncbi:MAG: transketolase [Gemmatimonadetes bacterium]|nr:MAG: transketolase [Gemmatimonadota bacterium]
MFAVRLFSPAMPSTDLQRLTINTIRTLSMDAVQAAKSGHPGTPMAMAPVVYCLWQDFLRFDPGDPIWPNRDRFVLSMGHASMLLYSMLALAEVKAVNAKYERLGHPALTLDDIKRFRQLDSKAPGHPEYRWTSGVETTTGPLGQGVATSVGMAIAGRWMARYFNRPGFDLFDYDVYALAGDGCMMEGISGEAASLAGHLQLSNLCWIYDNNKITIEGHTDWAFSEDVATRFIAYRWNVTRVGDANDLDMLRRAFHTFRATTDRPTLIIVDSHIAYGAPNKQDTSAAHGEPLGEEEIRLTKRTYGWPEDAKFLVPDGVREHLASGVGKRGRALRDAWFSTFEEYRRVHPALAEHAYRMQHRQLPDGWDRDLPSFPGDAKGLAGRDASAQVLNAVAKNVPWLIGGSADLAPSTKTRRQLPDGWDRDLPSFPGDAKGLAGRDASAQVLNAVAKNVPWLIGGSADLAPSTKTRLTLPDAGDLTAENPGGRNLHFGVREHAMGAVLNGLALSKVRAFGSGFLIFSDYGRPALRLAALMEIPVIYVFTHDSIGAGEDGPTHQPIEQLASLRAIPGLITLRPADANEVREAWRVILQLRHVPAALVVSRQALPTIDRGRYASATGVASGGYVLAEADGGRPDVLLLGTGSEVSLCVQAYERLTPDGVRARVVSMPSWELFEQQDRSYRDQVLPPDVTARVSVEQASGFGWERYVGSEGARIGMETFGASAPLQELQKRFGFTVDRVVAAARAQLERKGVGSHAS